MNPTNSTNPTILLTFDIEDWFQVENFKPYIPFSSWPRRELRVEQNTHKLLDLLDQESTQPFESLKALSKVEGHSAFREPQGPEQSRRALRSQRISDNGPRTRPLRLSPPVTARHERAGKSDGGQATDHGPTKKSPKATFFVLGWIAERLPHLVKEIHSRGHEIASHGYSHELCNKCSQADLEEDLVRSKKLLEDIIGAPVYGYRAPSFSINEHILKIIEEYGYLYDSSYNSFAMHGRYGKMCLNGNRRSGIAYQVSNAFYELPISNLPLFPFPTLDNLGILAHFRHFHLPWGGGGYFRLIPFPVFKMGANFILGRQNAFLCYFHPWEIDPDQPKVSDAPFSYKFRHYINLNKTHSKLSKLIKNFLHCNFVTCHQYLKTAPDF